MPDSCFQSAPCCSATTRYIAKIIDAGELIVIDVVMSASAMPSNSRSMSASETMLTPHFPTSPSESSWSGSRPISVGRSKATLRPVPPACEQRLVARVGFLRRPEPGKLAHRPELAAVAGGMDAARVGKLARRAGIARLGQIVAGVEAIDRPAGNGRELRATLGRFLQRRRERLALPALLRGLGRRTFHRNGFIIARGCSSTCAARHATTGQKDECRERLGSPASRGNVWQRLECRTTGRTTAGWRRSPRRGTVPFVRCRVGSGARRSSRSRSAPK